MNLETVLSAIFALGAPAWLLAEQLVHILGRASLSRPSHSPGKNGLRAIRRAA
jgi:hypothetical protein